MNKKGFVKILEVLLAVLITMAILMGIQNAIKVDKEVKIINIRQFANDDTFRQCVIDKNATCVDEFLSDNLLLQNSYEYVIAFDMVPSLPKQEVYVESAYIAGNKTDTTNTKVSIYYWR